MLPWQAAAPAPSTAQAIVLALLPFLPAGRGALILIFGGLLVLPLSLLMSGAPRRPAPAQPILFTPTAAPAPPIPPATSPSVALPVPVAFPASPRPWAGTGLERAIRRAVGATQLLAAAPGHYVVRLGRCDSCNRRLAGCERERAALARAVAPYLQQAQVAERACAQRGRREPCTFDIWGR
jgi:hypothetical protein